MPYKPHEPVEKKCEVCGTSFIDTTMDLRRKYCSETCNLRSYSLRNPERIKKLRKIRYYKDGRPDLSMGVIKTCLVCSKEFLDRSRSHNGKYCSTPCKSKISMKKHYVRRNELRREYRRTHPDYWKNNHLKLKIEVTHHISDEVKCVKCGFSDIRALQIDHINGGGNIERIKIWKNNGEKMWKNILSTPKDEIRKRYQILCANCNWIKLVENKEHKKRGNGSVSVEVKHAV